MPAMDQNTCDEGAITDLTIAHYEARAAGGVGLLILETSAVAWPVGATSRHQPALSDDRFVPGLRRLAEAVHRHGSKMVVQMCHHGKTAGVDAQDERPQLVPSVPLPHDDVDISAISMDELMKMAVQTGGKRPTHRAADAGRHRLGGGLVRRRRAAGPGRRARRRRDPRRPRVPDLHLPVAAVQPPRRRLRGLGREPGAPADRDRRGRARPVRRRLRRHRAPRRARSTSTGASPPTWPPATPGWPRPPAPMPCT